MDKFGVRGVFEWCKGKKGSQDLGASNSGNLAQSQLRGRWNPISLLIFAPLWSYHTAGAADHWYRANALCQRKTKGGKTQGRGKHTINPLPKNGFGPPPLMIRFPRPFVHAMSFSLEETVRAACLQNEIAPEKLLNRYEKRFEKREKGSEKRSETRLKNF